MLNLNIIEHNNPENIGHWKRLNIQIIGKEEGEYRSKAQIVFSTKLYKNSPPV